MTGFASGPLVLEANALPTDPQLMPNMSLVQKCVIPTLFFDIFVFPKANALPTDPLVCIKISVTREKLPNVHKSCPKMISLEKLKILTPLQKLPKNVVDLGKLIVATGFEKLPKVL